MEPYEAKHDAFADRRILVGKRFAQCWYKVGECVKQFAARDACDDDRQRLDALL